MGIPFDWGQCPRVGGAWATPFTILKLPRLFQGETKMISKTKHNEFARHYKRWLNKARKKGLVDYVTGERK